MPADIMREVSLRQISYLMSLNVYKLNFVLVCMFNVQCILLSLLFADTNDYSRKLLMRGKEYLNVVSGIILPERGGVE